MKIAFAEVGRARIHHRIAAADWLPAEEIEVISPLVAELDLYSTGEQAVTLEGTLTGTIRLMCGRCGEAVAHGIAEQFVYLLTTREEVISELPEKECSDEECDTLYLNEPVIDVAEILQEQLQLAIPGKVLCRDDCRGLCPECGGSRNADECKCTTPEPDSPFAVLRSLKKD